MQKLDDMGRSYYDFEDFYYDSLDFVSGDIISDDYYEKNEKFLRELIFDIYTYYNNNNKLNSEENQIKSSREVGKIIEIFFLNFFKKA